jgi:hypothetical protein
VIYPQVIGGEYVRLEMHPKVQAIWDLLFERDFAESEHLTRCFEAWNREPIHATWAAYVISYETVRTFLSPSNLFPVDIEPPPPSEPWLAVFPDKRRALAAFQATWDTLAGLGHSLNDALEDPFLDEQLFEVSRQYKGSAIYCFSWWAAISAAMAKQALPDFEDRMRDLVTRIAEITAEGSVREEGK